MDSPMQAITLEEHVAFPALDSSNPFYDNIWKIFPERLKLAQDSSTSRLANMDAGNVTFQILSHLPGGIAVTDPARCRAGNDEMAAAIQQHPDRFGGFAALPMAHPLEAATELHRAVRDLGFHGALIDNHLPDGITHYDAERFWPVFAAAESLDVPIYLHPSPPSPETIHSRFAGNYPLPAELGLATGAWGWHENVGLHVLKLYAAGVFERFPNLKIVIGHMGELLPIMLHRIARLRFFQELAATRSKGILDVWDQNIWVTTSGIFSVETLMMVLQVTKVERVMYGVDYPFEDNVTGKEFLDRLRESGKLSEEEVNGIAFRNARAFLKLDV
ncbi:amidohydrolase family protein [Aspergillus ibericus CBS 121593]|uniref:Amidohydrolase 2 n=1 Tax=Aspergillus ibericus CBS 121593 TaxID=1448316 RepID=A0A395H1N5_9EURO|nr:amidohydrolase 2 [Aspergillus ibericus CBS 121593]RAL01767.1 amidohydrolase 2 [Aspergillus ibericus CBS 121593]